jgi:hypothetical protein
MRRLASFPLEGTPVFRSGIWQNGGLFRLNQCSELATLVPTSEHVTCTLVSLGNKQSLSLSQDYWCGIHVKLHFQFKFAVFGFMYLLLLFFFYIAIWECIPEAINHSDFSLFLSLPLRTRCRQVPRTQCYFSDKKCFDFDFNVDFPLSFSNSTSQYKAYCREENVCAAGNR